MHQPHIALIHTESVPSEVFSGFTQVISCEGLDLQIKSRKNGGPFAALEWLLPTAVIVYISKSYFDGFLKEMGKDHYNLLKQGFQKLREKVIGPSAPTITLFGSSGKITKEQPYSLVFSVLAEAEPGLRFKLLIQTNVSEDEYEEILGAFLEFLSAFHARSLDAQTIERLVAARVVGDTLLLAFNQDAKAIEPIDPVQKRGAPNESA